MYVCMYVHMYVCMHVCMHAAVHDRFYIHDFNSQLLLTLNQVTSSVLFFGGGHHHLELAQYGLGAYM